MVSAYAERQVGLWVVLGSFKNVGGAYTRAEDVRAGCGYDAVAIRSNRIRGFTPGFYSVIIGPFAQDERVQRVLRDVRECVPDAYIKFRGASSIIEDSYLSP